VAIVGAESPPPAPRRRGTHRSNCELEDAIHRYLEFNHRRPKSFIWTKTADQSSDRSLAFVRVFRTQAARIVLP
jgi:hypothetical protein